MNVHRQSFFFILLAKETVDLFDVFILSSVCGAEDSADQDRVLINYKMG